MDTAATYLRRAWRGRVPLDGVDATSLAIVAAMGLLDAVWSPLVPFQLPQPGLPFVLGALLGVVALTYATVRPDARIANFAFCAALWFIFPDLGARLTYLSASLAAPLRDGILARLDQAIGFDWVGFCRLTTHTRWVAILLGASYRSYFFQPALSMVVFMVRGETRRNSDLLNTVLVALAITTVVATVFPAYGPRAHYGIAPINFEATVLQHLRFGTGERFAELGGIICFPSFHTIMLILVLYAHRGFGTFWPLAGLNALMLVSIPSQGGHYAVDMFGAGAVAASSIFVTQLIRRRHRARRAPGGSYEDRPQPGSAGSWIAGPGPAIAIADQDA